MIIMVITVIAVLGLVIGSFANVLIDRLAHNESIMGRSHCDFCKTVLQPIDLIPVFSYMFLKGRCRRCHKKLSLQYPFVELLTAIVFVLTFLFLQNRINLPFPLSIPLYILWFTVATSLIVIFFTDVKYKIIPDEVQITLFTSIVLLKIIEGISMVSLFHGFIASAIVTAPILTIYLFTKGKGMGFGDVKLAVSIGFLLGIINGLLALYIAFVMGALVGLGLMLAQKVGMKSKIAFGPFLVTGMVVMIVWGEKILAFIKNLYGV